MTATILLISVFLPLPSAPSRASLQRTTTASKASSSRHSRMLVKGAGPPGPDASVPVAQPHNHSHYWCFMVVSQAATPHEAANMAESCGIDEQRQHSNGVRRHHLSKILHSPACELHKRFQLCQYRLQTKDSPIMVAWQEPYSLRCQYSGFYSPNASWLIFTSS